jgi:hypothetical protein
MLHGACCKERRAALYAAAVWKRISAVDTLEMHMLIAATSCVPRTIQFAHVGWNGYWLACLHCAS